MTQDFIKRLETISGFTALDGRPTVTVDADKYYAVYEAATLLVILVENLEAGVSLKDKSDLVESAKAALRKIEKRDGRGFFTRFETENAEV